MSRATNRNVAKLSRCCIPMTSNERNEFIHSFFYVFCFRVIVPYKAVKVTKPTFMLEVVNYFITSTGKTGVVSCKLSFLLCSLNLMSDKIKPFTKSTDE